MGDRLGLLEEAEESRTVTVDITPMKIYGSAEEKLNSPDPHKWPRGNYFKDGKRVVDLVLAYQPNKPKKENDRTNHEICRQIFQRKMQHYGLELEFEGLEESQDGETCFIKIHAPLDVLSKVAEIENLRMPVKKLDLQEESDRTFLERCGLSDPFKFSPQWQEQQQNFFTNPFRLARLKDYIVTDTNLFFPTIHRIRFVWEIICNKLALEPSDWSDQQSEPLCNYQVGIMWLIDNDIYSAAFPLHTGECEKVDSAEVPSKISPRKWLYHTWGSWGAWRYYQPLDKIKEYFGEKVGFYFAWLGFYTSSLVLPSIVGVLTVFYGLIQMTFDKFSSDVCNTPGINNLTLCRTCGHQRCPFTQMKDSCFDVRFDLVMDNYATPIFALFMALWSASFLERWKQAEISLAAHWEVVNIDEETVEQIRPEYQRAATQQEINPITQEPEPVVPNATRAKGLMKSALLITFMVLLVIAVVSGITIYKIVMKSVFWHLNDPTIDKVSGLLVSITGSIINTICILTLEKVYERLAWWLTEREHPRTEDQFESAYIFKMFTFQFVNFYSLLFYMAFIAGNIGEPNSGSLFADHCTPGQCYTAVVLQLAILFTVKQLLNQVTEVFLPMLQSWWKRRKNLAATEENPYMPWERDFDLQPLPRLPLFSEYFEMIVQYGFTTMFVTTFPLAPLLSLINNITEIRVDSFKFLVESRRVMPQRARNIGIWNGLINFISHFAVLTNGLLIAFSTTFIDKMVYIFYHNGDLDGFLFSYLSRLNPNDWPDSQEQSLSVAPWGNVTECYYVGMRHPWTDEKLKYHRNEYWWRVNLARLVFIIAFEHIIFLLMGLVDYFIPDVPEAVETRLRREKFLARQALFNAQFEKESEERRKKRAKKLGKFGSISTLGSEAKKKGRSNKERASPITLTPSPPASLHSAKMPEPEGIALAEETIPADYGSLPPQSPSKRKTSKLPTLKGLFKGKSKGPSSGYTEI